MTKEEAIRYFEKRINKVGIKGEALEAEKVALEYLKK